LKQALRDVTGGRGIDVVYDCVGGDTAEQALRALIWQGRFLVVGFASGTIPKLPLNLVLVKGVDVRGVFWGEAVARDTAQHIRNMDQLLAWVAEGRLQPHISQTFPLADAVKALGILDRREAQGKIILTP
jgi:NADPH:quinone reductase